MWNVWGWIDKLLTDLKDHHMPALFCIFSVGTGLAWFHHLDSSYVEFTGLLVGAVTGHAYINKGDGNTPPQQGQ